MSRTAIVLCALGLSACGGSESPPAGTVDTGIVDGAPDDTGTEVGDAVACDEVCRTTTLRAKFGATEAPFERAVYGVTSPEKSASKQWELHIEALHGGFTGCPVETSPTPDRTLVIAGITQPFDAPRTYENGVRASLLDFKGVLTTEPILRATAVTVTPRASEESAYVAFELDATFSGGTIAGHVYAVHCDSLDDR